LHTTTNSISRLPHHGTGGTTVKVKSQSQKAQGFRRQGLCGMVLQAPETPACGASADAYLSCYRHGFRQNCHSLLVWLNVAFAESLVGKISGRDFELRDKRETCRHMRTNSRHKGGVCIDSIDAIRQRRLSTSTGRLARCTFVLLCYPASFHTLQTLATLARRNPRKRHKTFSPDENIV